MRIRSLVLSSFAVAACCLLPSVRAYGAGGSGGAGAGSDAGLGAGGGDPSCTAESEQQSGTTCVVCDTSIGLCSDQLGNGYSFVCTPTTSGSEIWCNGPTRTVASDNNVACAVQLPGALGGDVAALGALGVAALAVGLRRRRR